MVHLLLIIAALLLLAAFFFLVEYETRHGVRFYPEHRARLDEQVTKMEFILTHVDLGAFLHGEVRSFVSRVGHDIVHVTLVVVRAVERLLTRIIRHQHAQNEAQTAPRETSREFVKTLADFKEQLEATRPEIPDIHSQEG